MMQNHDIFQHCSHPFSTARSCYLATACFCSLVRYRTSPEAYLSHTNLSKEADNGTKLSGLAMVELLATCAPPVLGSQVQMLLLKRP